MVTKTKAPPDFQAMRLRLPVDETEAASFMYDRILVAGEPPDSVHLMTALRMAARLLSDSNDLGLAEPRELQVRRLHEMKRAIRMGFRGKISITSEIQPDSRTEKVSLVRLELGWFKFELLLGNETDRQPTRYFNISWDAENAPQKMVEKLFELIGMREQHFDLLEPSNELGGSWLEASNESGSFTVQLMVKPGIDEMSGVLGEI